MSEKRESGAVALSVYGYYLKSAGLVKSILIFLVYILTVLGTYVVNFWVGAWMEDKYGLSKVSYNLIYVVFGIATCIMAVI